MFFAAFTGCITVCFGISVLLVVFFCLVFLIIPSVIVIINALNFLEEFVSKSVKKVVKFCPFTHYSMGYRSCVRMKQFVDDIVE